MTPKHSKDESVQTSLDTRIKTCEERGHSWVRTPFFDWLTRDVGDKTCKRCGKDNGPEIQGGW